MAQDLAASGTERRALMTALTWYISTIPVR